MAIHKNNFEIVKILINSHKINVNDITPKGVAILIAIELSLIQIVKFLLENGADPEIRDRRGNNAFDIS